jgi:Helix-turn-helix domain
MIRPPRARHWWPLLLSFVEAAEYSGIDDQRLRRMAAKGEIDVMSVSDNGGKKKIPRIALDRLITPKQATPGQSKEATS